MCEVSFRSRQGKTVIVRVYGNKVEITGDFFTSEEELEKLEKCLSRGEKSCKAVILGVEINELYRAIEECRRTSS
ncbi:hypothetical protein [Stygiolobus sp. RP850M]|uniref:hypothetical protein n=1 Tax=Stygiolobus sp. RP850M TaxID=3133137 RepID=UPI00307E699F